MAVSTLRTITILLGSLLMAASLPVELRAERPIAPRLLPEQTVVYFRVGDMPALRASFAETSTGRMARDPQLQPLLGQLWQAVVDAFKQVEDQVGAPLNDLLAIPQGEVCVAIVAPKEGRPQLIAWLDCGDRMGTMQGLLDRGDELLVVRGATRTVESLGDVEMIVHDIGGRRQRRLAHFVQDNTVVLSSDPELAKQLWSMWNGEQDEEILTLADNQKFTAILSRCQGTKGEEPQVTWFADPIEIVRRVGRGNVGAQTSLAVMQSLGVDGFLGVGGSLLFATEEFDGIFHTHILLDNPRRGVIDALALEAGEVAPEVWVPSDVASYTTMNWDVAKTYAEVVRLFEIFRGGEGVWKQQVLDPALERTGLDLERDVLQAVAGRFTLLTWMEKPARLNSQSNLIGVKLKDVAASRQVLERVTQRFADRFEKKSYAGVTYYQGRPEGNRPEINPELVRMQEGCIAIMDDYLILSDSSKLLQQVIATKGGGGMQLATELDFKIIASKIQRHLGENHAGMISFNRPEEAMRQLYDLASSQAMRGALKGRSENNPFFKSVDTALNDNPLPPFAVLAQYLAPGGALLTSDETGFHYMAFSLRRTP